MAIFDNFQTLVVGTLKFVATVAIWSVLMFPAIFGIYHAFTKHSEASGFAAFIVPPYAWFMTLETLFWHKEDVATVTASSNWTKNEICDVYLIKKSFNTLNSINKEAVAEVFEKIFENISYTPTEDEMGTINTTLRLIQEAVILGDSVKDSTLTKIHPEFKNIWRNEYKKSIGYYVELYELVINYYKNGGAHGESLKKTLLFILKYQEVNIRAEEAEVRFNEWSNRHLQFLQIPELPTSVHCMNSP